MYVQTGTIAALSQIGRCKLIALCVIDLAKSDARGEIGTSALPKLKDPDEQRRARERVRREMQAKAISWLKGEWGSRDFWAEIAPGQSPTGLAREARECEQKLQASGPRAMTPRTHA